MSSVLPIKPIGCCFTLNNPSRPSPPVFLSPCTNFLSDHILTMLFKHPILARGAEALEEVQKLALKIVKWFRHVPYEAPVQQLRLFFLTHRRIRGNLISMFKITHNFLLFPMESTFTHPTREVLRGHAYKFHQQKCCRQFDFTLRVVLFWNKRPAKIVNEFSVKSFRALLDAHWQSLFPEVPI